MLLIMRALSILKNFLEVLFHFDLRRMDNRRHEIMCFWLRALSLNILCHFLLLFFLFLLLFRFIGILTAYLFFFQFWFLINHMVLLLLWCILFDVTFLKILIYDIKFWFISIFRLLPLFLNNQSISVFQRVLCTTLKVLANFRPLFESIIGLNELHESHIFIKLPRSFFELRTQIASPVFPALFCISINFILILVELIKFLRDFLPIMNFAVMFTAFIVSLLYDFGKMIWFKVTPWITWKSNLLQTEPFEHTSLSINSWN